MKALSRLLIVFVLALCLGATQRLVQATAPIQLEAEAGQPFLRKRGVPSQTAVNSDAAPQQDDLFVETQIVTVSDGGRFYDFGRAVALEGETALVGAPGATSSFRDEGAVYVFGREAGSWQERQKLVASDGEIRDNFGAALALAGDTAMITADEALVGDAGQRGAVYVFVREGGEWRQQQKLTIDQRGDNDSFGNSVVMEGDVAFISAIREDVDGTFNQGAVYVFEREAGEWRQQQKLTASDGARGDFFGDSLALNGETAFVGAAPKTINGNGFQGAVYVFVREDGRWRQQQKLTASDGGESDQFGSTVVLEGETALIAADRATVDGQSNQGAVYVFTREGGSWREQQKLLASDGARSDQFGNAVALNGETALISAREDDVGGVEDRGSVYLFVREAGSWREQQKLTASDGAEDDNFGYAVAMDNETALIGTYEADFEGTERQGKAYFFERGGQQRQPQTIDFPTPPAAAQGYAIGAIVSLSATASSGLPVDFRSATPEVCTVEGNEVALIAAGECRVVATQPGDGEYAAASETISFEVVAAAAEQSLYLPLIAH